MQQDEKKEFSRGRLIVPAIELKSGKVEVPAIERFAKKGSFIWAVPPPLEVKKPHSLPVKKRKEYAFEGLVYFYPSVKKVKQADIPQNSADAVILNLNDEQLIVHFFEASQLSTYRCELKLTPDQLKQLKALPFHPKKLVDLEENGELLRPFIWEALKQGKRLNGSCFGYNLGALKCGSQCIPIRYVCTEKTEVVARLYARDFVSHLEIYEVRVVARNYAQRDSNRPEVTEESDTLMPGYMFGTDLEAPHKIFVPSSEALFTTQPKVDQTRQGSFGNCFLLAVIKCISLTDANFILEMMKQDDQGIVVRFYQENSEGKFIPVFKRVPNAIIYKKAGDGFFSSRLKSISSHQGGLWLHALENAYAALDKSLCPSFLGKYGHGGSIKSAFEALTGNPVRVYSLRDKKFPKFGEIQTLILHKIFSEEQKEPGFYKRVLDEILTEDSLLYYLFDQKEEDMILFVKELREKMFSDSSFTFKFNGLIFDFDNKEMKDLKDFEGSLRVLCKEITSLLKLIEDSPAHSPLKKAFDLSQSRNSSTRTYKEFKYGLLPGPELSGRYTLQQVQTYDHIQSSLRAGKLVAASTLDEGEMPPGLASNHAYAIVGCQNTHGYLYILMRNPWGYFGLKYENGEDLLSRIEIKDEVSTVELSDFFKFFDGYQVGTLPKIPSLGLKSRILLDYQIKPDQLHYLFSSLEAGFITYGLLPSESEQEHKESEGLTDLQKMFLEQEVDSYLAAFTKYIQQRITALDHIYSFQKYAELKDDASFPAELAKLLDPKLNGDLHSSVIGGYLFYMGQMTGLRDYTVEILTLMRQVKEWQNNFILLKSDTQLLPARRHASNHLTLFKKIIDSVEEIIGLSDQLNVMTPSAGPHLFSQSIQSSRQSQNWCQSRLSLLKD